MHEPLLGEDYFVAAEHDNVPPSAPASPTQASNAIRVPQRNIHPHINGIFISSFFSLLIMDHDVKGRPCNKDGLLLPPGTPPLPRSDPSPDTWDPFDDQVQFRMGEFLYKKKG